MRSFTFTRTATPFSFVRRSFMRKHALFVMLLLTACRDKVPEQPPPHGRTRAPIGFVGKWVQTWPDNLRGDTLTLHANFSASGLVPRYPEDTLVTSATRWKIQFTSHDPVAARQDWYGHRNDGGDRSCVFGSDSTCISGPLLCIGDTLSYHCVAFQFSPDSLRLSTGARFVRASGDRNELPERDSLFSDAR